MRVSTASQYRVGERNIMADQSAALTLQTKLAAGKRILTPADDPAGAAAATALRSSLAQANAFTRNQSYATNLLNLGESAVADLQSALNDARDLLVQAGNGTLTDSDRQQLAQQLEGTLGRMVGLGNSSDGNGGYLFAGSREGSAPFTQNGTTVSYDGDARGLSLEVAQDRYLPVKFSGRAMFEDIARGNGTFTTAAAASNTGAGIIDAGSVTDPSAVTGHGYSIAFTVVNGATSYAVTDTTTSTVVASGPYAAPADIAFDGVKVKVDGTPASGDRFTLAPSARQSLFATVADAIATLRQGTGNAAAKAQQSSQLAGLLASVDQAASRLAMRRTDIGSGLSELDAAGASNDGRKLQVQTRLSAVEDLDYAAAASELSRVTLANQAAIQSYSMISKLSLFNYL